MGIDYTTVKVANTYPLHGPVSVRLMHVHRFFPVGGGRVWLSHGPQAVREDAKQVGGTTATPNCSCPSQMIVGFTQLNYAHKIKNITISSRPQKYNSILHME